MLSGMNRYFLEIALVQVERHITRGEVIRKRPLDPTAALAEVHARAQQRLYFSPLPHWQRALRDCLPAPASASRSMKLVMGPWFRGKVLAAPRARAGP